MSEHLSVETDSIRTARSPFVEGKRFGLVPQVHASFSLQNPAVFEAWGQAFGRSRPRNAGLAAVVL